MKNANGSGSWAAIGAENRPIAAKYATLTCNGFAFEDLGRYGVLKGFDAIDMGETKFMNVLNRTALIVEGPSASK